MFVSVLDIFKPTVGPSSSHTHGPMVAAFQFRECLRGLPPFPTGSRLRCDLYGSLAATGRGHGTDRAVLLGLHGFQPNTLAETDVSAVCAEVSARAVVTIHQQGLPFTLEQDLHFRHADGEHTAHPNGMRLQCIAGDEAIVYQQVYYSIGGGFICHAEDISVLSAPIGGRANDNSAYPFDTIAELMRQCSSTGLTIAAVKRANELQYHDAEVLDHSLQRIWLAMRASVERGLATEGVLPGRLQVRRRAPALLQTLNAGSKETVGQRLCAYAMAVNEENAAGHPIVTAPTNGAAGIIPAILYHYVHDEQGDVENIADFLLTAAAIGAVIKTNSSISGAEVGCQGEVGSASAMAAAGLCAVRGGSPQQVERAAEIALEHHLGLTCDPVAGLVQVPCIERNGFGAVKAATAAALALNDCYGSVISLDACIAAMRETGREMSAKFKETSAGGLAVSWSEC